jgi:hypothetical protein
VNLLKPEIKAIIDHCYKCKCGREFQSNGAILT